MSFSDQDDEPKTQPEPQEKEGKGIFGDKSMKDLIPIVLILAGVFLFKDQIMGLFQGGGGGAPAVPTGTPSTEATPETAPAETKGKGKGGGRHKRGGRGGKRGGRRGGKGGAGGGAPTATEEEPPAASNYVGIANA